MVNRCRSIGSAMHEDVRGLLNPDESGATLASLSQIEDGGFAEAEATIDGDAESLILHRDGDAVRAWLNICPHAGRRLDWAPGQFLKSREGHLVCAVHGATFRSAEHTSELQSLMRISYAVFCLQKKKHTSTATSTVTAA